nr:RNA-directed DNA polymerase, eukaryota, reverse transcriptase zinc-binding domain protein [Tanacetum cinerariifolium]
MPLDILKPPDPIAYDFCALTGMSSEDFSHAPFVSSNENKPPKQRVRPKGIKNWAKNVKINVQNLGSASVGVGALPKRLRSSKIDGKGRSRSESSPMVGNGKRPNSSKSPVDDALVMVLDKIFMIRIFPNKWCLRKKLLESAKVGSYDHNSDVRNTVGVLDGFVDPCLGFAVALAVLVTGASQSRQNGRSESNHKDNA